MAEQPANAWRTTLTRRLSAAAAVFLIWSVAIEARLIYGWSKSGDKLMSVIFEFNMPGTSADLRTWANRWHRLGNIPFGPDFNRELIDNVVNRFVGPQNLSQFRTNERLFATPPRAVLEADDAAEPPGRGCS